MHVKNYSLLQITPGISEAKWLQQKSV